MKNLLKVGVLLSLSVCAFAGNVHLVSRSAKVAYKAGHKVEKGGKKVGVFVLKQIF